MQSYCSSCVRIVNDSINQTGDCIHLIGFGGSRFVKEFWGNEYDALYVLDKEEGGWEEEEKEVEEKEKKKGGEEEEGMKKKKKNKNKKNRNKNKKNK